MTIRLRPFGAPGGAYAELILVAPDADVMQKGERAIEQSRKEVMEADPKVARQTPQKEGAFVVEARARQWIALGGMPMEDSSNDST
jgi:hypothetical protein